MRHLLLFIVLALSISTVAQSESGKSHGPDCGGGWPTNMAFAHLKNAGLADNKSIDFAKTETVRLASENIGKNLWHQVYFVRFVKKSGGAIEAIAVHDASTTECSMTGVKVFVVSQTLNPEGK